MKTIHTFLFENSMRMDSVPPSSVDLIVTSPPYPMIKMWDDLFCSLNPSIKNLLKRDGAKAFELMHKTLDSVWDEVHRVLKDGGIACINIGDATRTINDDFCLYSNHSRILHHLLNLGLNALPDILWRKQTNAPNKFMGSGMLPAGAYVTLEHEFILVMRKGSKRVFKKEEERKNRRESAFFWEERNLWFSDVWMDIKGTGQALHTGNARLRSAAYPFEIAYRLINMFSAKGDVVLDPFLGTGTTTAAAMAAGRNSIGFEIDPSLNDTIYAIKSNIVDFSNEYIQKRIRRHLDFVKHRMATKGPLKHTNIFYGFPVVTRQEKELVLNPLKKVMDAGDKRLEVSYLEKSASTSCQDAYTQLAPDDTEAPAQNNCHTDKKDRHLGKNTGTAQMELFSE